MKPIRLSFEYIQKIVKSFSYKYSRRRPAGISCFKFYYPWIIHGFFARNFIPGIVGIKISLRENYFDIDPAFQIKVSSQTFEKSDFSNPIVFHQKADFLVGIAFSLVKNGTV